MLDAQHAAPFPEINQAYNRTFRPNQLSLGLVVPIEAYPVGAAPTMENHVERVQLAEALGFSAVWLRDVPFNVPSFGDVGQVYDPFVYLGALAASTKTIGLGVASVILPLRHPAHVAKAAATADVLSGGRLLLGIASGDRPEEYPALNMSYEDRGARFQESVAYMRALQQDFPNFSNSHGVLSGGVDLPPKPAGDRLPLLITGGSRQSPDWVARNGDGWMTYPRDAASQGRAVDDYRRRIVAAGEQNKPVMQSLYVDVMSDPHAPPRPIHLGFQSGVDFLGRYLREIQSLGVNHVALNLRFNQANVDDTLQRLADQLLPDFAA